MNRYTIEGPDGELVVVTKARPTRLHRPAITSGILGTVYAVNDDLEARYFDYHWGEAYRFAGIAEEDRDVRLSRPPGRVQWIRSGALEANPGPHQRCLWVLKKILK